MMIHEILTTLKYDGQKNLLLQGLPTAMERFFNKLSYSKSVTPLLCSKKIDFALIFSVQQIQLLNILSEVVPALQTDAIFWIAYPKTTSKIVSDLNRGCDWGKVLNNQFVEKKSISIDSTWSGILFQQKNISIKTEVSI